MPRLLQSRGGRAHRHAPSTGARDVAYVVRRRGMLDKQTGCICHVLGQRMSFTELLQARAHMLLGCELVPSFW